MPNEAQVPATFVQVTEPNLKYIIIIQGKYYNVSNYQEYIIDYDDNTQLLPGIDICSPGSKATSIESGKIFRLTTGGQWVSPVV